MNCERANQIDLVDYLFSLGYTPAKINAANYWYLSPLRKERTASFKVNKSKNSWYDHGIGKGGKLIDFACAYYNCSIAEVLGKISGQRLTSESFFHPQKKNSALVEPDDRSIQIVSIHSPILDPSLNKYLEQRKISQQLANQFCKEIQYTSGERNFSAIGFKNNAGGYELRSQHFKGSSSPKYVTWFNNHQADSIAVFEGFFDFLSYRSGIAKNGITSNILVLNSLSFFTRSLLLMEKHQKILLYLDNDHAGKACVMQAMQRSNKVVDESGLYKGAKDLNDWWMQHEQPRRILRVRGLKP